MQNTKNKILKNSEKVELTKEEKQAESVKEREAIEEAEQIKRAQERGAIAYDEYGRRRINGKLEKFVAKRTPQVMFWLNSLGPVERMMWTGRLFKGMNVDYKNIFETVFNEFQTQMHKEIKRKRRYDEIQRNLQLQPGEDDSKRGATSAEGVVP